MKYTRWPIIGLLSAPRFFHVTFLQSELSIIWDIAIFAIWFLDNILFSRTIKTEAIATKNSTSTSVPFISSSFAGEESGSLTF